jgi:polyhydroxybutyrate depolymerase
MLTEMKLLTGLLVFAVLACSQSGNGGTGGSPGSGGAAGSGGTETRGAGGAPGTGGAIATGGAASGGAKGSGGMQGAGGTGTAGSSASGGGGGTVTASGGTTAGATGGRVGSGGVLGTGGATSLGTGGATSGPDAGTTRGSGGAAGGTGPATGGTGGSVTTTCPGGAKPADGKKTVMVGTTSRSYYLHIPAAYDGTKPAPLVVDFHGLGGSGSSEASSNPYRAVIDPEGVVSAYPDGVNGTNGTGWNLGPCCTTTDDVAFAKALVQDVAKVACIDPKRVYAVGFSLGGGMVQVLACKAADVFAAASPAAADLVQQNVDGCVPARPITVFTFRGSADTAVPYSGGSISGLTNIGAQSTFQTWAKIDQCTGAPSAADSNGCSTYASCGGGVQVTLCTKQGGGHEAGNASVSWPVLKKYTLP